MLSTVSSSTLMCPLCSLLLHLTGGETFLRQHPSLHDNVLNQPITGEIPSLQSSLILMSGIRHLLNAHHDLDIYFQATKRHLNKSIAFRTQNSSFQEKERSNFIHPCVPHWSLDLMLEANIWANAAIPAAIWIKTSNLILLCLHPLIGVMHSCFTGVVQRWFH